MGEILDLLGVYYFYNVLCFFGVGGIDMYVDDEEVGVDVLVMEREIWLGVMEFIGN